MIESKYLKDNMQNIQRLMDIPALKHFEIKHLSKLLKLSKIREYEDGEIIIKEGDHDPWLYFLLKGEFIVKKKDIEIVSIDKKGELFGEMRIIDSLSRSASVYAVGKTVCLAVDTSAKNKLSSDDEKLDFVLLLYQIFAEYMSLRLRLTNEELFSAKSELKRLKALGAKPSKKTNDKNNEVGIGSFDDEDDDFDVELDVEESDATETFIEESQPGRKRRVERPVKKKR